MVRHIYVQEIEPSLSNLLKWMEEEMTVQLRSGVTMRKGSSSYRHGVHSIGSGYDNQYSGARNESTGKPATHDHSKNPLLCFQRNILD